MSQHRGPDGASIAHPCHWTAWSGNRTMYGGSVGSGFGGPFRRWASTLNRTAKLAHNVVLGAP